MANHDGTLLTGDFMRLRVLWGVVCLVSLVLWYVEELRSLTWIQGAVLIVSLSSMTCAEVFLAPRLKRRAGLTMFLTVAELLFLVWLAWFLPHLGH